MFGGGSVRLNGIQFVGLGNENRKMGRNFVRQNVVGAIKIRPKNRNSKILLVEGVKRTQYFFVIIFLKGEHESFSNLYFLKNRTRLRLQGLFKEIKEKHVYFRQEGTLFMAEIKGWDETKRILTDLVDNLAHTHQPNAMYCS